MNLGVYQSASALTSIEDWQAVTSRNIASSTTSGYRAQKVAFEPVVRGVAEGQKPNEDLRGQIFPGVRTAPTVAAGSIRPTQNPLDFALNGQGFFEVQTPNGRSYFTRDGQFKVSGEGTLVDKNGNEVQGMAGRIDIDPAGGVIGVEKNGQVLQNGVAIGQLRIMEVGNMENMRQSDAGFEETEAGAGGIRESEGTEVLQGFVEGSNVSPINEMVNLIQASRAYEANAKVVRAYDTHLEKTINQLAPQLR
ncbi:MAG: flagellar hook-basal body protein [Verrucomicrobiota bacterium]